MHEPVLSHVEDYLAGKLRPEQRSTLETHLSGCVECQAEVAEFQAISQLVSSLRMETEFEPAPGFYGRVWDRIENQASNSFWNFFLEPVFARRLAYATITVVALGATYWFSLPPQTEDVVASIQLAPVVEAESTGVLNNEAPVDTPMPAPTADIQNVSLADDPNTGMVLVGLASYRDAD